MGELSAVGRVVVVVSVFVAEVVVVDVVVLMGHLSLALALFGRHAAVGGGVVAGLVWAAAVVVLGRAEQRGRC